MHPTDAPKQKTTKSLADFVEKMTQYLCPPGNGVYTVHTGRAKKEFLHQRLYGTPQEALVQKAWQQQLHTLPQLSPQIPLLLGICSDAGGGIQRGANWGPLAIREALGRDPDTSPGAFFDVGDVRVIPHLLQDEMLNEKTLQACRQFLYPQLQNTSNKASSADTAWPVSPLSIASDFLRNFYHFFPQHKVLGLGGDHSVSYPLVYEYLWAKKLQKKKVAVLHFDAHTDLLSQRMGIDICFGSWAYHILPLLSAPDLLIQVGIRASGKNKSHWESTLGVKQYWAQEVLEQGASPIGQQILQHLQKNQVEEIYVSFDIDALDAEYASCTGTPEPLGLAPHQPILLMQEIMNEIPLTGADLVEVAPNISFHDENSQKGDLPSTLMASTAIMQYFLEAIKLN